jgi:hypothetical protein
MNCLGSMGLSGPVWSSRLLMASRWGAANGMNIAMKRGSFFLALMAIFNDMEMA